MTGRGLRSPRLTDKVVAAYTRPGVWEDRLVGSYLSGVAKSAPNMPAIVDRGRVWTYGELNSRINQAARALQTRGISVGDVVSWQLPNWAEAVVVHHAVQRIGAVSNPIMPIFRGREVTFILAQARSKVFIIPRIFRRFDFPSMVADLRASLPDLQHVLVVDGDQNAVYSGAQSYDAAVVTESWDEVKVEVDPNDVCLLLYTSGTTSDPKGVLHTHNTLDYENRTVIDFFHLNKSDVVFMPSPVAHITGLLYGMQMPFMLASSAVFQDTWSVGVALELIESWRCSFMLAATPFLHGMITHPDLASRDVSSLRNFACGGADVPPELIRSATVALSCHVTRVYGSTEFPTATCSSTHDSLAKRAETDGRAISLTEINVLNSYEEDVPPGPVGSGQIYLRGPELFVGYLDHSLDHDCFDTDGWFATGDLATIDPDGFVTITGRQKDIIIRGGENISAKEVEDQLFSHPSIADVAVVGYRDPVMVERVAAVIVPANGAKVDQTDITEWLRRRDIAMQKFPEKVFIVSELPRTASGKVQKFKVRDYVAQRLSAAEPAAGPTRAAPSDAVAEDLTISPDSNTGR